MNDPEYVLLTDLKQYSKKAYYHAVHTAYFCEKIARKIGADEMLAKAGGYYHKIGRMRGEGNLKMHWRSQGNIIFRRSLYSF